MEAVSRFVALAPVNVMPAPALSLQSPPDEPKM
jgi:hypothetical protein